MARYGLVGHILFDQHSPSNSIRRIGQLFGCKSVVNVFVVKTKFLKKVRRPTKKAVHSEENQRHVLYFLSKFIVTEKNDFNHSKFVLEPSYKRHSNQMKMVCSPTDKTDFLKQKAYDEQLAINGRSVKLKIL